MQGLFNELWANQDVISVNHIVDITLPVGFLIDYLIVPYPVHYRLHFLLLELQVWTPILIFILGIHWPISRIWKKCFVERGWRDCSSWPYDDLQRCSARHYQWFHVKGGGSRMGVRPDTPAAEGQTWVWRTTSMTLTISFVLSFLRIGV